MSKSLLYTRTGDLGTTSLVGGTRISKADVRLEAYGTVDELNSWLGVLVSAPELDDQSQQVLLYVQHRLFDLGAYLATPTPADAGVMPQAASLGQKAISRLEMEIDNLDAATPEQKCFILPGGTQLSGFAQVARTVCRRAERCVIRLSQAEGVYVDPDAIRFVNRLSDYLFILSRYINFKGGVSDTPWEKE
ncbi:MAG: cob(I)yrinic acid a,c-diamide adenosyltransferase [Ruminococcus flavefaciens]|nr:cob(I)yrinic acid a,c-diamide adenosyltransferase [Ruminococcus flavefaciens]